MIRLLSVLIALLFVVGCGSSEIEIETSVAMTVTAELADTPTPSAYPGPTNPPSDSPTTAPPTQDTAERDTQSICGADQWELIPISVEESPSREGWKRVVVRFAVTNGSQHWGAPVYEDRNATITTEEGFTYPIHRTMQGDPSGVANSLSFVHLGFMYLPPGFSALGWVRSSTPASRPNAGLQLAFEVAQSQEHYVVRIPSGAILCPESTRRGAHGEVGPLTLDLDRAIHTVEFPTLRPPSEIEPLVGAMIEEESWSLVFTGVSRSEDKLSLELQLTNKNKGFDTQVKEKVLYLIGDDGVLRPDYFSKTLAPDQSSTISLAYSVDPTVNSLYVLWADYKGGNNRVFSIPGDS